LASEEFFGKKCESDNTQTYILSYFLIPQSSLIIFVVVVVANKQKVSILTVFGATSFGQFVSIHFSFGSFCKGYLAKQTL